MKSLENNNGVFDDPQLKDKPIRRFLRLLNLDKKELSQVYVYAVFSALISLSLPLVIQAIISLIMAAQYSSSLFVLIGLVTLATFFSGVFQIMQLRIIEDIQRRIVTRTTFEFALKIPRFKLEYVMSDYPPELINRFFDILTVEKSLPKIIIDLSISIISITFGLLLLSAYHPFFVFFGMFLLIVVYLIFRYTGMRGLETSMKTSTYKYKIAHWLEELGRSLITFKLEGNRTISIRNTDRYVGKYLDAREKHFKVLITQYITVIGFKTLIIGVLLIFGAYLLVNQQINLGQFVAAEIIIYMVISAVEKLVLTLESIYDVLTGMEKISKVLSMPLEKEGNIIFESINTNNGMDVQLSNLSYSNYENEFKALKNINLSINKGETVCVIGKNGCGKSTLAHLLSGLYSGYKGTISYNGIPQHNYEFNSLKNTIGYCFVPEDIFAGTLLDNLTLGEDGDMQHVLKVCEDVGLMSFVQSLKNGFDEELIPENKRYPRSILKKIIIARNILKRPALLIIDDFMAQFEANDRYGIVSCLVAQHQLWTLVVVSNDAKIAAQCDRVLLLNEGEIAEDGTFEKVSKNELAKNIMNL